MRSVNDSSIDPSQRGVGGIPGPLFGSFVMALPLFFL